MAIVWDLGEVESNTADEMIARAERSTSVVSSEHQAVGLGQGFSGATTVLGLAPLVAISVTCPTDHPTVIHPQVRSFPVCC